jgi:lactoylglutathione lyase
MLMFVPNDGPAQEMLPLPSKGVVVADASGVYVGTKSTSTPGKGSLRRRLRGIRSAMNTETGSTTRRPGEQPMNLGAFSISLAVKDLTVSREFYEKLGFEVIGGVAEQNWLILRNGEHTIGLFQGMFEKNILTFNPGWGQDGKPLAEFTDVRELQRTLKERGVELQSEADESTTGPASLMLVDPDGNGILVDQHV